jgi:hypothetical protein
VDVGGGQLLLHDRRHERRGDELGVGVRERSARRGADVLERQGVRQPRVGGVGEDPLAVRPKQPAVRPARQVGGPRHVLRAGDHHLVPPDRGRDRE